MAPFQAGLTTGKPETTEKTRDLFTANLNWKMLPSVSLSPDRTRLAILNQNHVDVWDVNTGEYLSTLQGMNGQANVLSLSPDDRYLALSDANHVYLYETGTGRYLGGDAGTGTKFLSGFIPGDTTENWQR